jgi:predicted histidine transporter YuiF (NhaC family)
MDSKVKNSIAIGFSIICLLIAIYTYLFVKPPTILGFIPIILYSVLVMLGFDVVLSTVAALLIIIVMTGQTPIDVAKLFADSLGAFITVVGLIIILGSGLGQVARETGVVTTLVKWIIEKVGVKTQNRVQLGVMIASTTLVALLGTLAGANAILAPIVIPIVAALGFTPPALAAMLHSAGACGLFIGPFTPPVVTLTGTTGLSYTEYLMVAGIPMAATTWIVGFFMARWIQKKTYGKIAYEEAEALKQLPEPTKQSTKATYAFILTIAIMVIYGIYSKAPYSYAIVVMLTTSFITGLVGGKRPLEILQAIYTGASRLIWLFLLFWLFNPLITLMGKTGAYDAMLSAATPILKMIGPYGFCVLALLIGWLGVSGAAVAQVVLVDSIFKPIVITLGIPSRVWVGVLLGSSQIDWFGPFPNADMVGQMGLARSKDLRMQLLNGWAIMAANILMFLILFAILLYW